LLAQAHHYFKKYLWSDLISSENSLYLLTICLPLVCELSQFNNYLICIYNKTLWWAHVQICPQTRRFHRVNPSTAKCSPSLPLNFV
jgi:hypothetical protein